ncbi:tudor domain-containing protein 5-like isoform X1 [Rhynchophorus ferrugineus]|uniref:tudor domain-containing protein 5-like isoform X1 n=1 Tax=Rhynchophorus ferrugineus TaxID=354439 RepID=UPI003FCDE6B8
MTKLEMKSIIRSLLISSNFVLRIDDPEGDFKELVGYELSYNKFKSKSTEEYLRTIPDVCQVQGTGPSALVFPNIVPELAQKIIQLQKCNEIKKKTYNGNQAVNSSNTKQTNTESNIPKNVQENLQILISYFKEGKRLKKSYPLTTMATK